VLKEGWPKYNLRLDHHGALVVKFGSTNPDSIERERQRFWQMGLEKDRHFSVKMPEEGRDGYVSMLVEGLKHAAWLSVHGSGEQRELAAEFVDHILQKAEEEGKEVYEKANKIIEEDRARRSLTLKGFEKEVEVNGEKHVVKVIDGGAELDEGRSGKKLLRIKITAEVDGVRSEYEITFGKYNNVVGRAYARSDALGGEEAGTERLAALIKALTGKEPRIHRMKDEIKTVCYREHLEGFKCVVELAESIAKWLKETSQ
jgi:hypothetical protein